MHPFRLSRPPHHGFTLVELLIVMAIVGILAAVAYPSYAAYVLKSRRSDGLTALSQNQVILERCYAQNLSYNGACAALPAFPLASPKGYYSVALSNNTATTYTLTATTTGTQVADTICATMIVDQANQKTAKDTGGVQQAVCWNP